MSGIAVISDVHGNLEALEAVLACIDGLAVDAVYSLGDAVGYGPDPEACLRVTASRCRVRLMGNHEYAVLHTNLGFTFNPVAQKALEWTRGRVRDARLLDLISGLQPHRQEGEALFVHGSARDALEEYVTESDSRGYSVFDEMVESLEKDFTSFRLCFVGHNHRPFLATTEGFLHPHEGQMEFRVPPEEKLYVSVGSVDQPRDRDPRACFVTFDGARVVYHRVPYDHAATSAKIRERGLPGYLAERIAVGR